MSRLKAVHSGDLLDIPAEGGMTQILQGDKGFEDYGDVTLQEG
ncbi:MAG TPA: hypothetical protein PK453_08525 [Leptospiraceae bacterium]|nr:hypothetical protein [Leptospiraceae bacterium]HMY67356.1 hypothetical protein [Leptospiraceae bacterium]HNF13699.1 hypothetical protein [Leptospiraceae bacterium]HNF27296.1 hypothetical protein [Leptospiraceae bacterium]HNH07573.1 hypothetical protein [Leptospiraceae bacterium]